MLGPAKKETRKDRVCSITVTLATVTVSYGTLSACLHAAAGLLRGPMGSDGSVPLVACLTPR